MKRFYIYYWVANGKPFYVGKTDFDGDDAKCIKHLQNRYKRETKKEQRDVAAHMRHLNSQNIPYHVEIVESYNRHQKGAEFLHQQKLLLQGHDLKNMKGCNGIPIAVVRSLVQGCLSEKEFKQRLEVYKKQQRRLPKIPIITNEEYNENVAKIEFKKCNTLYPLYDLGDGRIFNPTLLLDRGETFEAVGKVVSEPIAKVHLMGVSVGLSNKQEQFKHAGLFYLMVKKDYAKN